MPSSPSAITLRLVGVNDWPLWRKLRLQALEEAPYAFGSRLADWQGEGDAEMRWRTRLWTVPVNIIAELNETAVGMVSATAPTQDGTVELISMWVAPIARGHGVGDSLVRAVLESARERQASRVALAVFEGNKRAASLYWRHGFVTVGAMAGTCPGITCERQMIRDL